MPINATGMPIPALLAVLRPPLNFVQVSSDRETINMACGRAIDVDQPAIVEEGVNAKDSVLEEEEAVCVAGVRRGVESVDSYAGEGVWKVSLLFGIKQSKFHEP